MSDPAGPMREPAGTSGTRGAVVAFAPATVGNLSCGFDVLGLALEAPGDRVAARLADEPGVRLRSVEGDQGRLPLDAERNGAGVAARALLEAAGRREGVELDLVKGTPLSGGMGGSAASAVAAVVAVDALLALASPPERLFTCALAGERRASSDHADNVGPSLLGGIVLVRPSRLRPFVRLPVPEGLSVALLHPSVEVDTRSARESLGGSVPLSDAVVQWGNTAALVAALHTGDMELLGDALVDRVAEPHRSGRIPGFGEVMAAAREAGAVGSGISGSGPAMFALARTLDDAGRVGRAMQEAFRRATGSEIPSALHLSPVSVEGAHVVEPSDGVVDHPGQQVVDRADDQVADRLRDGGPHVAGGGADHRRPAPERKGTS